MSRDPRLQLWDLVRRNRPKPLFVLLLLVAIAILVDRVAPTHSTNVFLISVGLLVGFLYGRATPRSYQLDQALPAPSETSLLLAPHPELRRSYASVTHSLKQLAEQSDEILKEATMLKLAAVQDELETLAAGKIVFSDTEAWRTTYERLLRAPGLKRYLSVAWLRNEDYWRDAPGRHSMRLNYDLIQLGVRIERTLILNDFFWPAAAVLPAKIISDWIQEQDQRGIAIRLVRESDVEEERELLSDFGLYGDRACGLLELDEQCQTVRFTLDFSRQSLRQLEDRWQRLLLFAVPFRKLLDQKKPGG